MTSPVSYTAIVLSEASRSRLLSIFGGILEGRGFSIESPRGNPLCHHMTCNMGKCPDDLREFLGESVSLILDAVSFDQKCAAVRVKEIRHHKISSKNETPHITIGCNYAKGGKPVMSNNLKAWSPIPRDNCEYFEVDGVFQEVHH